MESKEETASEFEDEQDRRQSPSRAPAHVSPSIPLHENTHELTLKLEARRRVAVILRRIHLFHRLRINFLTLGS